MKYDENFNSISEILGSTLESKAEFSNLTKKITLFSFWENIAGKKFANSSKPYAVRGGKLFVTCKNAYVLQDLQMYKFQILKKMEPYAKGLDFEIKDIVFNGKNWQEGQDVEDYTPDFYDEALEIENAKLSEDECHKIEKIAKQIEFLDDDTREKLTKDIKNCIKAGKLRKK